MRFVIYQDVVGEWRWALVAANNKRVANAGEGYRERHDCVAGITLVRNTNALTPIEAK